MDKEKWLEFCKEMAPVADRANEIRKKYGMDRMYITTTETCTYFTYHDGDPGEEVIYNCHSREDGIHEVGMLAETPYATIRTKENNSAADNANQAPKNETRLIDAKTIQELKSIAIEEQQNTGSYIIGKTMQMVLEKQGLWDE